MLEHWLKPVSGRFPEHTTEKSGERLGADFLVYRDEFPDLKKTRLALVGAGDRAADAIRAQLYNLSALLPKVPFADLGNLRKPEPAQLIPVLHELLAGRIMPVVLGDMPGLAKAQFLAYQDFRNLVNLAVVDETVDIAPDACPGSLCFPRHPLLFHLSVLGVQHHLTPAGLLRQLEQQHVELLRLGKARMALDESEPVIRDADVLAFQLRALRQSEAPGVHQPSPSGFFCEEACQLCRYAGMSDKLSSFGIYGYAPENDPSGQTAAAAAQMVWYFLEGWLHRKNDYPVSKSGLTEYIVEFRKLNYQLTFWKSAKSGRWWMEVPVRTKRKHQRHALVPCSYQDYQAACREELPDRLMLALQRFG